MGASERMLYLPAEMILASEKVARRKVGACEAGLEICQVEASKGSSRG